MLNPKQTRFVQEYLLDLNGKQAAIRAGYSPKTAEVQASRLLSHAKVAAAVADAQAKRAKEVGVEQNRVLTELAVVGFSSVQNYTVDDNGDVQLAEGVPEAAWRALSSIKRKVITRGSGDDATVTREVELRLWDKPGTLRMCGQHLGMFVERVGGPDGGPLAIATTVVHEHHDT